MLARLPELISNPTEKERPYPSFNNAGSMILPTAITVAGLDAEIAPKNMVLTTVVKASPPVSGRTNALAIRIIRREMPPFAMKLPA